MASPWPNNSLLTTEQFILACPEFGTTDLKLVDLTLGEAAAELDPSVWGDMLAAGHKYLTAHKLALSPMGNNTRLMLKPGSDGSTTYATHFNALVKKLPIGVGIAGWPWGWSGEVISSVPGCW